jgi:heptosyltransferase-3
MATGTTDTRIKSILICQCRNFGDSVIGLGLIEALAASMPELQIDVLTRPQFAPLHSNHPRVRAVYTAAFPVGTMKSFGLREGLHLTHILLQLRRKRYDAVVNLFGDVRENIIGWLVAPAQNYGFIWPVSHPILNQMRIGPRFLLSKPIVLPETLVSFYEAVNRMAAALGANHAAIARLYRPGGELIQPQPVSGRIGLHVSAGQECKRWPVERWVALGESLIRNGYTLRIYCAPEERKETEGSFAGLLQRDAVSLMTGTLDAYLEDAATCAVMVCHDSFAAHAEYALGAPCILINGGNVAAVWAPPLTTVIRGNEALACFPCFNRPSCTASAEPYRCIRDTSPQTISDAVNRVLHTPQRLGSTS